MSENVLKLYLQLTEENKEKIIQAIDFLLSLQSTGQQSPCLPE